MASLSFEQKFIAGRPPDKGSFPLDHDGECKEFQVEYTKCLKRNQHDNMSCRYLSKQYMQCRMDKGLMEKQRMEHLGFSSNKDLEEAPARNNDCLQPRKEKEGYVSGVGYVRSPLERNIFVNFFSDIFGSK